MALLFCAPVFSQKFQGESSFAMPIPQGSFAEESSSAIGVGGRMAFHFKLSDNLPLHIGIDGRLVSLNRDKLDYSILDSIGRYRGRYRLQADGILASLGLLLRFQQPNNPRVTPFVEGMMGFNFFRSETTSRELYDNYDDDDVEKSIDKTDNTYYLGVNLGVKIHIDTETVKTNLLFSCAYLIGGRAEYGDNPQIGSNREVQWDFKTSRTNVVLPQIGFCFDF